MSWDKNTLNFSTLDATIKVLKMFSKKYKLTVLGKVKGLGLNDDYTANDTYTLRKLTFENKIVIEQMQRTYDCDSDDIIVSIEFDKKTFPKKVPLEIYTDEGDFVDCSDCKDDCEECNKKEDLNA